MSEQEPLSNEEWGLYTDVDEIFIKNALLVGLSSSSDDFENAPTSIVLEGIFEKTQATATLIRRINKVYGESILFTLVGAPGENSGIVQAELTRSGCYFYSPEGDEDRIGDDFVGLLRHALKGVIWDRELSEEKAATLGAIGNAVHEMLNELIRPEIQDNRPEDS